MRTHLVIPDPHATPGENNRRAEWVGRLINDVKPDVVVVLGDTADMPSLCSYDRGKKSFQGRTYQADIEVHGDFQERLWGTVKKSKRRLPLRVTLIGNHEQRIERAIEYQPELEGVISYNDLELDRWYDVTVPYNGSTPGTIDLDGVLYGHYIVSGVAGRPIGGEHGAYSLLSKKFTSCTVGHSHLLDYCTRVAGDGQRIHGLVAGCFQEHSPAYAGESVHNWWRGVVIKRNVEDGCYDPEFVSIDRLRKEYG